MRMVTSKSVVSTGHGGEIIGGGGFVRPISSLLDINVDLLGENKITKTLIATHIRLH